MSRPLSLARALAFAAVLASASAWSAPHTLPLVYVHDAGDPSISASGFVTFDDTIWTPNQNIFGVLTGLIAVSITVSGGAIPGGSTTFTLADMNGWAFHTDGANRIDDINFFSNVNGTGCRVTGVDPFLLSIVCDDTSLATKLLVTRGAAPVPALGGPGLALLALLLASLAAVAAWRRQR